MDYVNVLQFSYWSRHPSGKIMCSKFEFLANAREIRLVAPLALPEDPMNSVKFLWIQ